MEAPVRIDNETCSACGLCGEVCPNRSMQKDGQGGMFLRPGRVQLCIRCGQCMAICPSRSIFVDGLDYEQDFLPLPAGRAGELPFLEMIQSRRAIRTFKERPVPRELLEKVLQAITFAPVGFTPIQTEVVVVQDPAVMRQALPEMVRVYDRLAQAMQTPVGRWLIHRKVGGAKFRTLEGHVIPVMKSRLPELKQGLEDTISRGAPAMILFHAHRLAENYETDVHIALTYGFLAAHALGLGATVIDLIPPAVQNSPALRQLFRIPVENVAVSALILGYPRYRYQRGIQRRLKRVTWI